MISGRLIKLVVFELLEFAAFSVPTLVIMEQFATAYQRTRNIAEKTHYWLIVSCSIAYVACVTLLIWVPVKVLLHKKHHLRKKMKGWEDISHIALGIILIQCATKVLTNDIFKDCISKEGHNHRRPVMMMCVVLTTLPSFSFSIAVTEVQKNGIANTLPDTLPDLSVSLVLTCLIVVDIIEKLRIYPLRGSKKSGEERHIHPTTLQQITTVTEQVRQTEENPSTRQADRRTELSRNGETTTQNQTTVLVRLEEPSFHSGILKTMSQHDVRAEIFLWSFLQWSDTIEMVRVAGHPAVYKSGWVYPVYIFSFISLLRIIFTPRNPLLNSLGILLQDIPFIFVRLSLIIVLGTITPVLGLCKNVLVTLSYVYFTHLIKLRVFSTFELS